MHHYLFTDIPHDFVVPFKNSWDVHPFNFVNPRKTFMTLAETSKGPALIEVTDNIVAAQFNLDTKYPETIKILKNSICY